MNRAGAMMMPLTFSRYADPEGRDANLTRGRDHHEQDGDFPAVEAEFCAAIKGILRAIKRALQ